MTRHTPLRFRLLLSLMAVLSLVVAVLSPLPSAFAASTLYVSTTGSDSSNNCLISGSPCQSIGGAIAQASSGDTINVAAGTYTEQINIGKSLTLTGAGSGTTTIQAPAVLTSDPDGAKTLVLFTGLITAEFRGFTVAGPVNGLNFGIYIRAGATANIHDNVIKDIREAPLSGAQIGVAIEVGKYPDTAPVVTQTGTATITNNTIIGYQKTGIAVEKTGSSATITGNTITGAGPITTTAQNGIQIRRGATGTVETNTVTGNAYDGPTWSAEGIGALRAGNGVVIRGNTVNHNSANIYSWNSDGIQILNNQVSDSASVDQNKVAGITVQADGLPDPYGGATGPYLTGVTISGNTIRNNLSGPSTLSDGIDLYGVNGATVSNNVITGSSYDGILIGGSGNIAITGNQFSENGLSVSDPNAAAIDFRGIPSRDWSQPLGNGGANPLGGFTVHSNKFTGNRRAIWNYDSGVVDATNNWWGSAVASTIAAGIGGSVTSAPYYVNSGLSHLNTNVPSAVYIGASYSDGNAGGHSFNWDAFTKIQTGVNAVASGGTVNVAVGTYTEVGQIVINKNLTIVGADKVNTIIKPDQDTSAAYKDDSSAWILVNTGKAFNLSAVTLDGTGRMVTNAILSHGSGIIDGNIIKNIAYNQSGPDYSGAGIALYGATMTVSNNSFTGIGREGVFTAFFSTATITGNTYTGKGAGNWLDYAFEVGRNSTATISGNTITGNIGVATSDGSTSAGMVLSTYYDASGTASGATITSNTITGNTRGIEVGVNASDASVIVAHNNNISGNDINVTSTHPIVDATNNWWSSASGPGSLTNITTTPWCTDISCVTKSENANLTSLSLSSGTLSPVFSSSTTAYSASVGNSVTSVTVTKSTNPGANAVVSGASDLSVGSNTVSVTVTSADGTATKTYTVTLTRTAASGDGSPPPPPPPPPAPPKAPPAPPTASAEVPVTHLVTFTEESKVEASIEVAGAPSLAVAITLPIGAVSQDVTVSIAPAVTSSEAASGIVSIKVTITDSTGALVTHFDKPLTLSLGKIAAATSPDITAAYSEDGLVWTAIVKLDGTTLPGGVQEGYYVAADGSLIILTRHLTYFGMKKIQVPLLLHANATEIPLGAFAVISTTGGSGSGAGVYLTGTPEVCTVDDHGIVMSLKAGMCILSATKAGDGTYLNISSSPLELTFVDLTPPAAPPTKPPTTFVKTITVTGSGPSKVIQVNLGPAFGGRTFSIQIRKPGATAYKTLSVVKLNRAGTVRTTRWQLTPGSTIRVLANNKTLVATIVRR